MDNKMAVRRVYVEKKHGFDVEASKLYSEISDNLLIQGLTKVRIFQRYDIEGITDRDYEKAKITVFQSKPIKTHSFFYFSPILINFISIFEHSFLPKNLFLKLNLYLILAANYFYHYYIYSSLF